MLLARAWPRRRYASAVLERGECFETPLLAEVSSSVTPLRPDRRAGGRLGLRSLISRLSMRTHLAFSLVSQLAWPAIAGRLRLVDGVHLAEQSAAACSS